MLFNSFVFLFVFLPIAYLVFWSLGRASHRYVWLTITGYIFYSYWNPWFCLLMAFSTLVSFFAGLGLGKYESPLARRLCLVIPITVDLSLLGFFKYANFGLGIVQSLVNAAHLNWTVPDAVLVPLMNGWELKFRDIILPVGISFYTFHTISYIVDAYRRTIKPTRNIFEFSAYVSLFSQLVAGPIVRFRQIEEDLENIGAADRGRWLPIGVAYFVFGLAEKVLVADTISGFVDPAFANVGQLSTASAWAAVLGYTFQLYFDFSGYSSMAMGLGYLFGLRIPINFNSPYKASDPSDFWRRWHISLSNCLRDYLYISLGGNRFSQLLTFRNLMLTMLIGGLWHGANWTFIVWGGYHGCLLALYRAYGPQWNVLPMAARRIGMLFLAMIGWVFFKSDSVGSALHLLGTMFSLRAGAGILHPTVYWILLGFAAIWATVGRNVHELTANFSWRPVDTLRFAAIFGAALALIAGGRNSPFLYFQF